MSDPVYIQVARYTQPVILALGTVGSVLNLILFAYRKPLRVSSCSIYFRALSFNDLLVLYYVVFPLWLQSQFGMDPARNQNWYCKVKTLFTDSLYNLSSYFLVLCCFDRLCTSSSSARLRRLASVHVASIFVPVMIVFVFLAYSHVLVGYESAIYGSTSYCYSPNRIYSRFISLFILFFLCIVPPSLMVVLCITTLICLRQQRRRIMPVNQARLRQRDNQLLKMLFIYVLFNVISTVPFAITYITLMFQQPRYDRSVVVLFQLSILLLNANFATSFYVYTLGTPFYRHELYNLIQDIRVRLRQIDYRDPLRRAVRIGSLT